MASKSMPGPPGGEVDIGEPPEDLTGAVVSGVRWKALTRIVAEATRAIVVVILAHLLTPSEYGVAGMAFVVTSFGVMLTDPALGAALIQRPTIDERDRSTVFWASVGIGVALTVVGVALSGLVADFFGEAQVQELFAVSSLCFVVISLSVAHRALLARRLAYRSLEIREMIAIVSGGAVAVAVALAGFGPWAIVLNFVVSSVMSTALVWLLLDWRPRATFSLESARGLAGFSGRIFSASVLTWGDHSIDKALVGRFLGAAALGTYSLAFAAMLLPMTMLGRPFNQVLSPAFSRIQDDAARLERAWLRSKRLSAAVVLPALLALVVVAPDFVPVVFGDQWEDAVLPLQLLCVGGLASSLTNLHWSVLQARGQASTLLRLTAGSSIVKWAAFAGGLPWGIVGVAATFAGARWLLVIPSTWMTTRGVSFRFSPALRAGAEMLPAAIAAAAIGFGAREALLETSIPQAARLVVVAAVMLVAYVAIVFVTAPSVVRELRLAVRRPGSRTSA
ncbi:lipopolysaccharide biosynthesis protein [soil metagenome]